MKKLLTFLLLIIITNVYGQKNIPVLSTNNSKPLKKAVGVKKTYGGYVCSYIEDLDESNKICDFFEGSSFISNNNAEIALNKILSSIGASKTFILNECSGVNNASATSYKGVRYIFYNDEFMNSIVNKTNSWSNLSILAHEVGHHINGHTMDMVLYSTDVVKPVSKSKSRDQELEADYFSGFVMAKLGASSSQATQVMAMISSDADDTQSSHPAKSKRLSAITKGYNAGYVNPKVVIKEVEVATGEQEIPTETNKLTFEDYFYSAVDKHQSGNSTGSLEDYNESIKLNNQFAPAFHNRAILKDDLKKYEEAISDYNKAIALIPDYPLYFYNRAISKNNIENYSGAIEDLNEVLKYDSQNKIAIKFRAQSHYNLKNFKLAIEDFSKLIEIGNADDVIYNLRGSSNGFLNQHKLAVKDFDKAISINPRILIYYKNRVVSRFNIGNNKGAIEDYDRLIEFDQKDINAYLNRGNIKKLIKDSNGACEDWTTAKELGSEEAKSKIKKFCKLYEMKKEMNIDDKDLINFKKKFDEKIKN